MTYKDREFSATQVLELACSAQRTNNDYVKEGIGVYAADGKFMGMKTSNKLLIQLTLNVVKWSGEQKDHPALLKVTEEDKDFASEIKKYYRRLMFAAIQGENEFQTKVNSLLESDNIKVGDFGFVACLPSVFKRDYAIHQTEKRVKSIDPGFVGLIGDNLFDKDCEVLSSKKSKNFDAYNIDAIIDNKLVSWFSKVDLKPGNCVVVKAKVKDYSEHWKHKVPLTRLNYVKAAQ